MIKMRSNDVLNGVNKVRGAVEKRATLPILNHICFKCEGDRLTLLATDNDKWMLSSIPLNPPAIAEGCIALPSDPLPTFLAKVSDDEMLTMKWEDGHATLKLSNGAKMTLPALDASEFPQYITPEGEAWECPNEVLRTILQFCGTAVSTEETRYYLNGIYLEVCEGELLATATDGHRLAHFRHTLDVRLDALNIILPRQIIRLLDGFLRAAPSTIDIISNNTSIEFNYPENTMRTKLIDGTFPDWRRVVPQYPKLTITIDIEPMLDALARLAAVEGKMNGAIVITSNAGDEKIKIVKRDGGIGQMELHVPAFRESDIDIEIGFNRQYLREALEAFAAQGVPTIDLLLTDAGSPSKIVPSTAETPAFWMVLMPMRI